MKILLSNTNYASPTVGGVGGAQRSVQFLAELLARQGHDVIAVSLMPEGGVVEEKLNGVRRYKLGLSNIYWPHTEKGAPGYLKPIWHLIDSYNPIMAKKFARILDIERPDVVHTNIMSGFSAAIWAEVKRRGIPLVHTLRDYYLLCARSTMFKNERECSSLCPECKLLTRSRRQAGTLVDAVIGISEFILKRHLEFGLFSESTIQSVVYNPLSYAEIPSRVSPKTPNPVLTLGFIGRLTSSKGIELLLETFQKLHGQSLRLIVAGNGKGDYLKYLQNQYNISQDSVSFIGHVRPQQFFEKIDVLVAPSLWSEPLGRVVFEAYSYGVPVIGSSKGGIPEMIEEGKTGYIFDPSETSNLEGAIMKFVEAPDLISTMSTNALEKSKEFFPEKTLQGHLRIYKNILEKS